MVQSTSTSKLFLNGVPYGPDIAKLEERFTDLSEGTEIPHTELQACLGIERTHQRYYPVINAWRNRLRNQRGIYAVWAPKVGIKILDPANILDHTERCVSQKLKQTTRALRGFIYVDRDRLNDTGKARLDHQLAVAARIKQASDSARKELAADLAPIKSLPRGRVGQISTLPLP